MKKVDLCIESLSNNTWKKMDVVTPTFNVNLVKKNTNERPQWVHFGAGNIFRGYVAKINHLILENGLGDTGIIAAESFDFDIIDTIYKPYDNLTLLVGLSDDKKTFKQIIAGVSSAYKANPEFDDYEKMSKIFENPSLQMVSFTITEKGYSIKSTKNEYIPVIYQDIHEGPSGKINHVLSIVASLLYKRYKAGNYPLALCSMDNCSHNGEKLKNAVIEIAKQWVEKNLADKKFIDYLTNENVVTFPWSMIDKITPRPSTLIYEQLDRLGVNNMKPLLTSKGTYIAPFVNAEMIEYLVIEDKFPNGRPKLEIGNVYLTDRETVNKVETMKVTTCLNPLQTALAVYGCLLGYTSIYDEMKNPLLKCLVEKIGYEEGMPVVVNPEIIDPEAFLDEAIYKRLLNPSIPDNPQRIATDTSQKIGIRYGNTINSYLLHETLDTNNMVAIPLAIAGWFRYLLAIDDDGNDFNLSSDPLLEELTKQLKTVNIYGKYNGEIMPILSNQTIFNVDLITCGMANKIETMFKEMIQGPKSVEKTLLKYLKYEKTDIIK